MVVAENIAKIEEQIQKACDSAGRKRGEITLMGVTKFVPVEKIKEAFCAGVRCFGESRVKEAAEKLGAFKNEYAQEQAALMQFHLIGSLQRNKARQAVLFFDCIQSADRDELIIELAKHSPMRDQPLDILLELHTGEETKSGYANIDALLKAAELVLNCKNLKPAGLMTMAPFTADTDLIRASFRQLVKAKCELEKRFPSAEGEGKKNWEVLSMGMSNDFEIAIEEGSTLLRIGSSIFKD